MTYLTSGQVGELLDQLEWRIRRLFEDGTLSDVSKFGGRPVIPSTMISSVVRAFDNKDWISKQRQTAKAEAS